jgi:uncharacterized membrane protein
VCAVDELSPSTLAGIIDVAPLLPLAPLLACYCFALVAALQSRGVVHGAKQIKALCAIFLHTSAWYRAQRLRGPWSFDWAPPMPQLVRELSVSVLAFSCLRQPSLLPDEARAVSALAEVGRFAARHDWPTQQQALARQHALLDSALSTANLLKLATMLADLCNSASNSSARA